VSIHIHTHAQEADLDLDLDLLRLLTLRDSSIVAVSVWPIKGEQQVHFRLFYNKSNSSQPPGLGIYIYIHRT